MIRIKHIFTLALALCCAATVFAQQKKESGVAQNTRAANGKYAEAQKNLNNLDQYVAKQIERQQRAQAKQALPRCAACGETITDPYQHCTATDSTGLCTPYVPQPASSTYTDADTHCSICGKALSIDERYHGVPHYCKCEYCEEPILQEGQPCYAQDAGHICTPEQNHADAHAGHCIYCGRPVTQAHQACEHGGVCTTRCPECGKDLRDPKNVGPNGTHHCRGKLHITPAKPKN